SGRRRCPSQKERTRSLRRQQAGRIDYHQRWRVYGGAQEERTRIHLGATSFGRRRQQLFAKNVSYRLENSRVTPSPSVGSERRSPRAYRRRSACITNKTSRTPRGLPLDRCCARTPSPPVRSDR